MFPLLNKTDYTLKLFSVKNGKISLHSTHYALLLVYVTNCSVLLLFILYKKYLASDKIRITLISFIEFIFNTFNYSTPRILFMKIRVS